MKVNKNVKEVVSPEAARELRMSAALGQAELGPADKLTAVVILTRDADEEIKKNSIATLKKFPPAELLSALEDRLDPAIINKVAKTYLANRAVLARVVTNPGVSDETLTMVAEGANAALIELISEQTERLRESEDIALALRANPEVTEIALERIKEFIVEEEPGKKDGSGEETGDGHEEYGEIEEYERESLYKMVTRMTVAEKMKLALKGNKEARGLLIKDSNRIVCGSVLKNPRVTDEEIIRLTASKGTSDELLRAVAREKEWLKCSAIKRNLVTNPKTPLSISMQLVRTLGRHDLENIAKSKNIPNTLASEARKALMLKKKHG